MAEHAHTTPASPAPSVTHVTPRRALFGAAALLALATPARAAGVFAKSGENPPHDGEGMPVTVTPHPDADLIAACQAFDALEHQRHAAFSQVHTDEEFEQAEAVVTSTIDNEQQAHLNLICAIPFTTVDGAAAVAGSLALWLDEDVWLDTYRDLAENRIRKALVRGLLMSGGLA